MPSLDRPDQAELIERINGLRRQRRAFILAHNYQLPEVQDIADFVGDSLGHGPRGRQDRGRRHRLLRRPLHGRDRQAPQSRPHGPHARPERRMPDGRHGHAARARRRPRRSIPDAVVVAYVNSSAARQGDERHRLHERQRRPGGRVDPARTARSSSCPTSASATTWPRRPAATNIILWPGFCPTHHRILPEHVTARRRQLPDAEVLRPPGMHAAGAGAGGFRRLDEPDHPPRRQSRRRQAFIIATEIGVCHTLRKQNPGKTIVEVSRLADCPNMKLNTLEKVLWSLEDMQYEVTVPDGRGRAGTPERSRGCWRSRDAGMTPMSRAPLLRQPTRSSIRAGADAPAGTGCAAVGATSCT